MLPTPSTSHVSFDTVYEPAEDSFLFLDTLSSPTESSWLQNRFSSNIPLPSSPSPSSSNESQSHPSPSSSSPPPLIVEIGTGSGVVLGFVAANSQDIFGRTDVLALGTDVNQNACRATRETVRKAVRERESERQQQQQNKPQPNEGQRSETGQSTRTHFLASLTADLGASIRPNSIDVLLFNPPYVPTEELPSLPSESFASLTPSTTSMSRSDRFEHDSHLLSLSYAGGEEGMGITNRLLRVLPDLLDPVRGVAYVLLCKQNRPEEVKERIRGWEGGWMAETVGGSGMKAGWEKLVIVRIWRGSRGGFSTST